MTRLFTILLISMVFFSCGNKDRVPGDIIQPEKMRMLLWDMARADEFVTNFMLKDSSVNKEEASMELYNQVLTIHKTNQEAFKKSINFYESNPQLMKPIFDSLSVMDQYEERKRIEDLQISLKKKKLTKPK